MCVIYFVRNSVNYKYIVICLKRETFLLTNIRCIFFFGKMKTTLQK